MAEKAFPFQAGAGRAASGAREDAPAIATPADRPLTVSELTAHIRRALEARFDRVRVEGEISNWRPGPSGHIYFVLKDAGATIACVLWRDAARRLLGGGGTGKGSAAPSFGDGVQVELSGHLTVYEPRGAYQIVVETMRPAGLGDLYRRFMELKARLEAEGLFAPERKRVLPAYPRRIGLITSPRGAAMRDVLNVLRRRFSGVEVVLQPARVQGAPAAGEIADALRRLGEANGPEAVDLILVVRGGGSLEDLWAFNEEVVARAIAACPVSVVSGVGHETDFTIADFVADQRAPTPSAAAELAVTAAVEWQRRLALAVRGLLHGLRTTIDAKRQALRRLERHPAFEEPRARVQRQRQFVDELWLRLQRTTTEMLTHARRRHDRLSARLVSLDPRRVLERGYAIVSRQEGRGIRIISDARLAPRGKRLAIEFANGRIAAVSEGPQDRGFQMGLDLDAGAASPESPKAAPNG